jgi:hypothetical protein
VRRACRGLGCLKQGSADPMAFLQAIERHDFQLVAVDVKCEQPDAALGQSAARVSRALN